MLRLYRTRILIILTVVIFAGAVLIAVLQYRSNNIPAIKYQKLATSMYYSWTNNGSVYYYNGSNFASYNLNNHTTTKLSDNMFILSNILKVNWSSDGAVFLANNYVSGDQLDLALTRAGLDEGVDYWWFYDFKNQKLDLLNFPATSDIMNVVQNNSSFYYQVGESAGLTTSSLYSYATPSSGTKKIAHFNYPTSIERIVGNELYAIVTNSDGNQDLVTINLTNGQQTKLISNSTKISGFAVGNNASSLLIAENISKANNKKSLEDSSINQIQNYRLLMITGANTNQQKIKSKKVNAMAIAGVSDGDYPSLTTTDSSFLAGDKGPRPVSVPKDQTLSVFINVSGVSYFVDNTGNLYMDKSFFKKPAYKMMGDFNESENQQSSDIYINSPDNENVCTVIIFNKNKPFPNIASEVTAFISQKGYDPNQFKFRWATQSNNASTPIPDIATILNIPGQ